MRDEMDVEGLYLCACHELYESHHPECPALRQFLQQAEEIERLRLANEAYVSSRDHVYEALDATARQEIAALARQLQEVVEERDRLRRQLETPTHYWSEDANCMEYAIDWEDFDLLEDCAALEPGAHVDFEVTPLIVLPVRKIRVRRTADDEYEREALTERSKS